MPIINVSHCHDFIWSRTATAAACLDTEANFGTPRSLVFLLTREEIRTGHRSTLSVFTPVMSESSLPSQCTTDLKARKSCLICKPRNLISSGSVFYVFFILETLCIYIQEGYICRFCCLRVL